MEKLPGFEPSPAFSKEPLIQNQPLEKTMENIAELYDSHRIKDMLEDADFAADDVVKIKNTIILKEGALRHPFTIEVEAPRDQFLDAYKNALKDQMAEIDTKDATRRYDIEMMEGFYQVFDAHDPSSRKFRGGGNIVENEKITS
jgi:hypothetical protein